MGLVDIDFEKAAKIAIDEAATTLVPAIAEALEPMRDKTVGSFRAMLEEAVQSLRQEIRDSVYSIRQEIRDSKLTISLERKPADKILMNTRTILLCLLLSLPAFSQNVITIGGGGKSTKITVVPGTVVTNIACPVTMSPGQTVTCTWTISQPAPAGGFPIPGYSATCTQPDGSQCPAQPVLNPPANLTVPPGATTVNSTVSI